MKEGGRLHTPIDAHPSHQKNLNIQSLLNISNPINNFSKSVVLLV